jgi:hypothetical protein
MREKFLPSYTKETTATINYLRHASESDKPGIVYYMDGHTEVLDKLDGEVIERYVSTKNKDMDVSKSVKHLDLYLDSPFLKNHVTLIDSPGLNGMKEGLADITNAQIKKSHAVIFMFSAEQPGKRSDFEVLKKIKDSVNTVFLVLNKVDCIRKSEGQTIEETIEGLVNNYKHFFPEDTTLPEVIPIAAYPALVARSAKNLDYPSNHFDLTDEEKATLEEISMMSGFEDKLTHFLSNSEKTVMQIKEPVTRLSSVLQKSDMLNNKEIDVLENERSGLELDNQIIELQKVIESLENEIIGKRSDIRKGVKNIEKNVLEYFNAELDGVRRNIDARVDTLSSIDVLDDEVNTINSIVKKEVNELTRRLDERFREEFFDQVQEQYVQIIGSIEEKMDSSAAMSIAFDANIEVTANTINAGIENFNEVKEGIEKEIARLEADMKNNSIKEDELIEMAAKADNLRSKAERIRQSQSELQGMYCPPEESVVIKTGRREVNRTGLFSRTRDFLFGKKTEEYSYEEKDSSARDAYISDFKEKEKRLSNKEDEIEQELSKYNGADKMLEKNQRDRVQISEDLERLRREKEDFVRKFNDDLNEKYEQEVIRVKSRMKQQAEDTLDAARSLIQETLKENRNSYTALLQDLLEQSIKSQLDAQQAELNNLSQLRETANYEKEEKLNDKRQIKENLQALIEKTNKLIDEVNAIEIDKIEYKQI